MGEQAPPSSSWFSRVTDTYNTMWRMIIRPPRDNYGIEELGPQKFRLGKRVYERKDLQLQGSRGMLECSHFMPTKPTEGRRPCVVYLHGNCSSRLEAFDVLPVLLPRDLTVFCLDLSGSGRSDGDYISLGCHEEKDLRIVLQHLRVDKRVSQIGLWGRSMGATTSILRLKVDHDIAACILDSAFRDLRTVADELVNRGRMRVPQFIVNMAMEMIRTEVVARANFDPTELKPIECAPEATCPAFFGVASDDTFVLPHHTQDLHDAWSGERLLRVFDGGHNGVRPTWFLEEAADFLMERLSITSGREVVEIPLPDPLSCEDAGEDIAFGVEDADMAAGHSSRPDSSKPSERQQLASELKNMGFSPVAVAQACKRCTSTQEALRWLVDERGDIFKHVETGPPRGLRDQGFTASSDDEPARLPLSSSGVMYIREESTPVPMTPAVPSLSATYRPSMKPPGSSVVEQLLYLGFNDEQAEQASRRCLTVERAVDWLSTQRVSLEL